MKRYYIKPNMDMIAFEAENIMTDSNMAVLTFSDRYMTDDDALYHAYINEPSSMKNDAASIFEW